jgi:hypothetical protein
MAFGIDDAIGGVSTLLNTAINKIWPDPADKAKAEAITMAAAADAAIQQLKASQAVMLAEEQSADKVTSRARPLFLYVMYVMILSAIPMGVLYAFDPKHADLIAVGLQRWLAAIPDAMWQLFMTGYLGYTFARGADKAGGVMPFLSGKKK